MEKGYSACFVTTQGIPEKYGINREKTDLTAIEALKQYLEKNSVVSADLKRSIFPI